MAMKLSIDKISSNSTSITVTASSTGSVSSCSWRLALYGEDGPDDDYQNYIKSFQSTSCPASFNNRTFTNLDPDTNYVVVCFGYADNDWSNLITSNEKIVTTLSQYTVKAIAGTEGIKNIRITSDIDSDSIANPASKDKVWVNVEKKGGITVEYTFLDGWTFDYLETSEGNRAYSATSEYTYPSVQADLSVTIYAKPITPTTVIAKAVSATEGVKIKVSGIGAKGNAVSAIADYGKSASIKVQIGSKVTWSVDTAGGYPQFFIELSDGRYATRLLSQATYSYDPLEADLTITYTGKPLQFGWTYHACDVNDPSKWLAVTTTGKSAYKWNQATADSTTDYKSYYGFLVTAAEWTQVQSYVNELRTAKGLSKKNFAPVEPGDSITATIFNDVINALRACEPSTTLESATPGNPCTARHFNLIMNAINSLAK